MPSAKTKHVAYVISSDCRKARGERLYQARNIIGKSLDEFAELIATTRPTLAKLEAGELDAKVKNLELAAYHSDLSVLWLMFGDIYKQRNIATTRDYYE